MLTETCYTLFECVQRAIDPTLLVVAGTSSNQDLVLNILQRQQTMLKNQQIFLENQQTLLRDLDRRVRGLARSARQASGIALSEVPNLAYQSFLKTVVSVQVTLKPDDFFPDAEKQQEEIWDADALDKEAFQWRELLTESRHAEDCVNHITELAKGLCRPPNYFVIDSNGASVFLNGTLPGVDDDIRGRPGDVLIAAVDSDHMALLSHVYLCFELQKRSGVLISSLCVHL
jgi:hypothetical protein